MSIPLILASQSPARRNVLFAAGICPTIHVSHVDEDAVLAQVAADEGKTLADLDVETRVTNLAVAKAVAVYEAMKDIVATSRDATGTCVAGYPLRATTSAAESCPEDLHDSSDKPSAPAKPLPHLPKFSDATDGEEEPAGAVARTRDFSGVDVPTESEPIRDSVAGQRGLANGEQGPLILGCDSLFLMDGECYGKPHSPDVARERIRNMRGKSGELWTGHCLIDMKTGAMAAGTSVAEITFGDVSDAEIDAYIATGEPLEVAGSFTLDGFGGAFIDTISGDPSGIIGLSLPLARQLTAELGYEWTDLWNVARADQTPAEHADSKGVVTNIQPPEANIHQPGDGWIDCNCGRRHWGTNGASGVLLARRDPVSGDVTDVVMQHRAIWSAEGGTWGIPGGATADGENAIEGALREAYEEANITPQDIEVVGSYREDHGNWAYTTVFAFEKPGHEVHPKPNDDESEDIEWVPIDEVPDRKLLTAMKTDWPKFARRLRELAAEHKGE
ncbi:Maf family protein [Bifidobacterium choloepi]|uniref:Nucleoside triphosphate pyrophosphatase n=1 Tax=Bifidobacterium choloepi TaxID=2614131 RepID=A0A6I5NP31_9BIFI|nr:Maf family protein [Bifidobacterium choloepi]NEG70462.1 NUDIX domain-containing protein [Bifidobacterium choloepi]